MKKPTILRTLIFVLAMMLNFASYSQNLISFNSKFDKNLKENIFLKASNQPNSQISDTTHLSGIVEKVAVPTIPNPVLKYAQGEYAGIISICPNDGKELPKLFLCGSNDARLIETGITNASSFNWARLTGGCTAFANVNCANEATNCTWTTVGTGANYSANAAGEYRLRITYSDGTVFIFYFNVYTNDLDPTNISKSNILNGSGCSIPGRITVGGFGSKYEYAISTGTTTPTSGWQDSNIFANITTAATYNVFVRLKNVTGTCVFRVRNIAITAANLTISTTINHPKCNGDKGSITVKTSDLGLRYDYTLFRGTTQVGNIQGVAAPEWTFTGLDPATNYRAVVTVSNACVSNSISNRTVNNAPNLLTLSISNQSANSGCSTGNLQANPSGGTSPYKYFVNVNNAGFVPNTSGNTIVVTTPGTYQVRVEDINGCTATASYTVNTVTKPNYNFTTTSPNCSVTTGSITVNLINANSYTIQYRINNGSWGSTKAWSNLGPGNYTVEVRYRLNNNNSWCTDTNVVTILDAPNGLTASAGVAALAGCGPNGTGIVRITNPSGGVPPYQYSFNGTTWGASNEANMAPNNAPGYTVYIRDSSPTPCVYAMTGIIIDPVPTPPRITYEGPTYDCNGIASMKAIVTSPVGSNYTYTYLLDDVENTNVPANEFINIGAGDHNIKVVYKLANVSTYSNLLKEDFGRGNPTTSPGINPAYCFENQSGVHPPGYACNLDNEINDGEYAVTNRINPRFGSWLDMRDHTSGGSDTQGRFLAINIGGVAGIGGIIYRKPIYDVIPNQDVKISFWVANLINNLPQNAGNDDPNITIQLIADYGLATQTLVASQETGVVPKSNKWENYNMSLNPGSYSTLDFVIRSYSAVDFGNDLTLDDITVYQVPRACAFADPFKFEVLDDKAFKAEIVPVSNVTCNGANNGSFKIIATNFGTSFEYSLNGSAGPWIPSTTSEVTVTGLQPKTYDVRVRRTGTNVAGCELTLNPVITSPTKFVIAATGKDALCSTGGLGSVDASATSGGTQPYNLVLTNNADNTQITFPPSLVLSGVVRPGTYTISGTDGGGCPATGSTSLVINGTIPPKADITKNTGLCFGTNATITVTIRDGAAPYSYSVSYNGGAYSAPSTPSNATSFNYTAAAPGTYSFLITDHNGCNAIAVSQRIDPKITATTAIRNSLTCDPANPDATIEVTISGGTAPYTYTVKNKTTGALLYTSSSITGPTFTYSTANPGTYTFDVKDDNGCIATIDGVVNSLVPVIASAAPVNPTCNGGTNGSVQLSGSGGVGPYMFSFNGGAFSNQSLYTGLSAGVSYSYQVRDFNQCLSAAGTITLSQPDPITGTTSFTPYTCLQTGSITVTSISGGTGTYQYSINGTTFQAGTTFTGLTNGTYTITVRDANNCTNTLAPVTLDPLTPPTALSFSNTALSCPTNKVSITVTTTGGSGALSYRIVEPASASGNTSGLTTGTFTNLDPGTYKFEVTDAKGCKYEDSYTVAPLPALTVVGTHTNVQCFGSSTGTAQFTVSGSTGFTYTLNTVSQGAGTSPISLTGLAAGTYTVEITNTATNCKALASVTITAPAAALTLNNTPSAITCDAPGSVVLTAAGGWGGNTYSLTQPDGTVLGPQNTGTFANLTQTGSYTANVTDANNCIASSTFTLSTPSAPSASIAGSDICYDANNQATITVTASGGVGPYQYSINNGTSYQSGNTFANLLPGSYTVLVKDAFGCTSTAIAQVIANQLQVDAVLTKTLDCKTPPAARITGTISGGTAPYTYSVSVNGGAYTSLGAVTGTTFTYDTTTAGEYQFQVNDVNNCPAVSTSVKIDALVPVIASAAPVDPTCNGGTNGSVQLSGSGGVGPYMFSFNGGAFSNQSFYTGLSAGVSYSYQVRDFNQCLSAPGTITLSQPDPITGTTSFTPYTCLQTGSITVTSTSGGTGTYQYSINGTTFQAGTTFTGLTNGTYTITVRDANNCTNTLAPVTLDPLTPPTALSFSNTALSCPTNKVSITVTTTGGSGALSYRIVEPASASGNTSGLTTGTFTNLDPGTYKFEVTDAKGCKYEDSYTVAPLPALTVVGTHTNVQCFGSSTGTAQFTVSGSTGFTYTLNTVSQGAGTSPISLTGLAAGTYTVEITNTATNCKALASVTITAPAAALTLNNTPSAITCDAPGSVVLTAAGGWGGNTYSLTQPDGTVLGPQNTGTFANLTQTGNYTANVTDANNCIASSTFTLSTPSAPSASIAGSDICYDANNQATITVTASGGVGPYQYSINNGTSYQSGNTFANLLPGSYTVLVKDAFGCTSTAIAQVIANQLQVDAVLTKTLDCKTPPAARITGTISGGTAPYTYSVSVNGGAYTSLGAVTGTTFTYDTTTAGEYQFQVNDVNNCPAVSTSVKIDALVPVIASAAPVDPTCNGGTNGSVQLSGSGGVGPYMFSFNGGAFSNQSFYTGLSAGVSYSYQVRDFNQCLSAPGTITLSQPDPITGTTSFTPYTCLQTGSITVTSISGGTGTYQYSINGTTFQAGTTFTGLTNGTYTITVRDANNCTNTLAPVTLDPLTPPTALSFSNTALSCPTNKVSITVTTTGGSGALSYRIVEPASASGNTSGLTTGTFTNLDPGTYKFEVTDAKGCKYEDSYTVAPLPALTVVGTHTNVQCFGSSTGTAQFTVSGSTGFTYTLNTVSQGAGTSPISLTGLAAGTYTVEITNTATNCKASASVTITAPAAALTLNNTPSAITCDAPGSVVLTASGGWGGNTYSLTQPDGTVLGPQNTGTFANLTQTGSYTANVTDANNCIASSTFTLSTPSAPSASIAGSDICYDANNQATITVTASGGVGPYQYSINNGTSYQSSGTFANLLPGSYTVLVKDAFGCTSTAIAQTIANEFTVATVLTDGPKCTSPNITIDGTINGGTANYNYTVTINGTLDPTVHTVAGTTFTYTDATAVTATTTTTYLFTFTDNSGCNATSTVVVQPKTNPDFTAVQGNLIYCSGQETGSINVNIDTTVGVGPYVINVVKDNTALGTPNVNYGTQTTGLPGGDYIVTVTDANGCSLNRNVSIAQPDPIVFTEDIQQIKCIGGGAGTALGSIGVTALAGGTTSGLALPAKSGFIYTLTSNTSPTQTFTPDGRENHSFQILNFGIYELTVTDFNGCSVTKTINIASPPEDMIIDVTQGTPSCTSATIVVSVTPPIPGGPYHFALYPVDPANPNNYDYATYSASYQDADAVSPPASPGDPDLLKSTFTGLNPGVLYSFIVYDESTNCYFFKQADTKTPTLSTLTSDLTESNVTCMNAGDGSVSFTFTKNYTTTTTVNYQVYNSQTNQPVVPAITGSVTGLNGNVTSPVQTAGPLVPGTYYILFTEVGGSTPGCTNSSRTFTITQSVVPVLVNATVNKNQNCNELGNISVSAQGGTAPYKYLVLSDTAPAPTAGDAWVDGSSFNLAAGNYIAYAKDANGCIQPAAVKVIPLDPTPVVAAVLAAQCNVTEGSFVINVTVPTAGVSPYTFSVDGGAFQSRTAPFSITGLSSGSHTIEIKDKNGCGNTVTVPILKPLGFTPEVTALPTCPNNDGQITVTAAGGSSTYSYELLDASASTVLAGPQASNVFNAVAAGSYQVRVTDVTTTCALVKPILLTSPAPVNFTASPTDVSCNGGSNGTIKVTLGAGNTDPVYTYTLTALSGPALVVGPQTSNLFTGLSARDYSISVASGRLGCSTPQTITVGQPPVLSVDASSAAAPFKCAPDNSTNTTIVTINGSGGFGDYTYSINNVDFYPTNTFTVADNGTTYNLPVYVKDANGCSAIGSVLITRLTRITTVTVAGTAIDCLNNGRADITVLGGSGNFSYQLLPSGAPQVDNFFGITAPGDYYFRVIDNDTDCYFDAPVFRVAPYNTIKAVATATTPVNCFGDANGALAINVTGYTGAYTYEVFNSAGTSVMGPIGSDTTVNPRSISGLSAGNYTVVVTETASPYCSVTTNAVTIGSPSEAVSVTASTVNDNCGTNAGQIIAEGHGGTAPYYYQILPQGSPAPLVTDAGWSTVTTLNAESGNYTVYVKDSRDCPSSVNVILGLDPSPVVAAVLAAQCNVAEGSFVINVTVPTAGVSPYTFSVDGGAFQSRTAPFSITGLSSGSHTIEIKDKNGCGNTVTVPILKPLGFTPEVTALPTCPNNDGQITVTAAGGSSTYSYELLDASASTVLAGPQASNVFNAVAAGSYQVRVTDVTTTCALVKPILLTSPAPVNFTASPTDVSCNGGSNGTIKVTLGAGNTDPVYTYTLTALSGPALVVGPQTSNLFTGLSARDYSISVASGRLGCSTPQTITVGQPPVLSVDASSAAAPFKCAPDNSTNTTIVTINGSGGFGDYTYSINNVDFYPTNTFTVADNGTTYNLPVYVKDANGCSAIGSVLITRLTRITTVTVAGTAIDCLNNGRADITVLGGSGNFSYQLLPSGAPQVDNFFGITAPGDYYFRVIDNDTDCYFDAPVFRVAPYNTIKAVATATTPVNCFGDANGALAINVTGYTGAYTYEVFNSAGTSVMGPIGSDTTVNPRSISGLSAGNYTVVVTETASPYCSVTTNAVTIGSPSEAVSVTASTVNDNCGTNAGQIIAEGHGGTAPYYYQILPQGSPAPLVTDAGWSTVTTLNAESGNYTVYVKDSRDCPSSVNVILGLDPSPVVAAVLAAQCNVAEGSFVINVTVPTAGVSPYTFSVDGGAFQSRTAPFSITGLSSGSHTIEIKDKNGCGNTVTVPILKPLGFTPEVTALPTCPNNDGQITVTAAGGSSTYSYELLDASASTVLAGPQASNVFNAVAAGSYQVRVTDVTTTCALVKPILLTSPAPVNFTASPTDVSCNGGSNGTIKVTLGAGNTDPVYTYTLTALSGPALVVGPQTSNLFTGLSARDYSISVASGRLGCSTPQTITVGQPPVLSVDASSAAAPFKCAPDNSTNTTIVTINGSGGFGDYTYSINNVDFYPTNTFTVADNGTTYNLPVYVKDANGCSAIGSVLITRLTRITTVTVAGTAIDCLNNGRADITVLGGSGNFSYQLLPSGAPQVDNFFGITAPGDYYFRVIDNDTDCYFDAPVFRVAPYNTIKAVATATTPVNCFGDANGALAINVTGYTGAYTYEVFNSAGTSVMGPIGSDTTVNPRSISGLSAGNYTVVVTETASPYCSVTTNAVTIGSPSEAVSVTASTVNDNCGTNAGQIIAEGHGGTAPYYYQILPQGSPAPLVTDAGWSTVTTLNAESGNYTVYVKDSRDCPSSVNVILGLDPSPVVAAVLAAQCNVTEGNFVINVTVPTAGVSPYTFSVDGGAFQSRTAPFSITGLSSGSHTIEIKDKNGCGNTVTVPILAPLELRSEITLTPVCNNPSGDITLFASGGTVSTPSSYVYTMNNWATSQSSPVFGGLAPGSYTFRVRDIVTNCEKEVTQIIENATVVTGITLKPTAVSCNGGSDGTISVELDASNNNPIYRYTLTATIAGVPLTVGPQDSTLFSGLSAGTYTVSVTSGRGCPGTATITVDEPAPIVVDAPLVTQYVCAAGTNTSSRATITVNSVNGGSNNYVIYEFTRGTTVVQRGLSNSYTETDYAGGSYSVKVLDSKGCSGVTTAPITIDPFISLDNMAIAVTPITCVADESIQVTVTTTGGTPPTLYYTVTGNGYNQTNTTGTFTDLGIGSYFITVENRVTNCMLRQFHNVINPNTFNIVAAAVNAEICYGATNGSVDLTFIDNLPNPTDKAGPFDYTISGPMPDITESTTNAGPVRISNLIAGDYKVVAKLRGTPECTVETVFSILQPLEPLALSLEQTRITCVSGNDDGTITATATGGWEGDYQFELVGPYGTINYSDQYKFENLREGTYTITVKDSKGCMDIQTITLTKPDPITFTAAADVTVLSCFGGQDATITVSAPTGGQGSNYTYTLNYTVDGEAVFVGPQSSNVFTNLGAGDYTVTVKDGFTCEATSAVISIANPTIIEPTLSLDKAITCLTNARLTLSVTGGTGPYTYSEDGTNYSVTSFNSSVTFEVTPGLHRYFVKDNVGCISYVSNDFEVIPVTPLTVELNTDNAKVNCKDESTALIVAEAVGGLGNYEYSLLDGAGTEIRPAQPDGVFADLPAGTYTVHVKSVDCEANSTTIVVSQPENALTGDYTVVPVKCFGDNNGKIVVTASGGTGTIKYAIEPNLDQFFESGTFERLTAGTYTVIVQDLAGCNIIYEIDVVQPNILTAYEVPGSMIPEICKGDKDGAFTIEIQGGTAPYFESLDKDNGPFNPVLATTVDYTGLSGGRHTVFIKDSNGCIYPVEVNMPESVVLDPKYTVSYDCVNNAQSNMVVITIDPSNNPADIDYSLDGGTIQPGNIFTNIPAGDHTIRVRHTNGCTADVDFNIIGYAPLQLTLTEEKGVWNVITASAVGGGGEYVYSIDGVNFSSETKFKIYKTGTYTITVRDKNGCTDTKDYYIEYVDVCLDNYFTPNGDGVNDTWGPGCTNIYNHLKFSIFDRYGRVIAKYTYGQKWDGRYNGEELPSGDYWYVLKLNDENDGREFVGHFTLYR